jgi:hypothetical protein
MKVGITRVLRGGLAIAAAIAVTQTARATLVLQDISGSIVTMTSGLGSNPGPYPGSNAINGNFGDFTHTDIEANPTLTLTLPTNIDVGMVRIWNRTSCCGGRLRDITVNYYSDAGATNQIYTSGLLNPGNVLGGGIADYNNGPAQLSIVPGVSYNTRVLTIARTAESLADHDHSVLSIGEIQVATNVTLSLGTDLTRTNLANMTVGQSSTAFPASLALDGILTNFTHTNGSDPAPFWEVDFNEDLRLQTVNLHNRGDGCCQSRLRDITVKVFNVNDVEIYSSALLNPENVLGGGGIGGPSDLFLDLTALNGGTPLTGARVRVLRLPDPDLSGTGGQGNADEAAVLSLGEVTVMGGSVPEPASAGLLLLGGLACAVRRRR